jgi:hypothetical protein
MLGHNHRERREGERRWIFCCCAARPSATRPVSVSVVTPLVRCTKPCATSAFTSSDGASASPRAIFSNTAQSRSVISTLRPLNASLRRRGRVVLLSRQQRRASRSHERAKFAAIYRPNALLTYRIGVLAAHHAHLRSRSSAGVVVLRHEGYHDAGATLTRAMWSSVFGKFNTYVFFGHVRSFMKAVTEALAASCAT